MADFRIPSSFWGQRSSSTLLLCSAFTLSLFPFFPLHAAEEPHMVQKNAGFVVPNQSLVIIGENPINTPLWRKEWQAGRSFVRNGEYRRAETVYARLLETKPELEAARWEYCQILDVLADYQKAEIHIETLLTFAPDRISYRLFAGKIALQNVELDKAAQYFGMVLEADPGGPQSATALQGLAASLRAQGKKQLSIALEEQLVGLEEGAPHQAEHSALSVESYHRLLGDALALDNNKKVKWILENISSLALVEDAQLQAAASFLHRDENLPVVLGKVYQEQLRRLPENTSIRQSLISFLIKTKRYQEALEQFDLALQYPGNELFLLPAGSLAMGKAKSFGKALGYYRRYLKLHPRERDVQLKIVSLHNLLAKDFLAIVENGATETLWLDMERFGKDRQKIFLQMAKLLKRRGGEESLQLAADVLQLLARKVPGEIGVNFALADVYQTLGNQSEALAAMERVPSVQRRAAYYEKRAELALQQRDQGAAIEAYTRLLQFHPEREDIRQKALSLCGALGLVDQAKKLFSFYSKVVGQPSATTENKLSYLQKKENKNSKLSRRPHLATLLLHLYFLAENRQIDSLQEVASWGAALWKEEPENQLLIRLEEADALRRMGDFGAADQLLREQLNRGVTRNRVLFALANNAADRGRQEEMEQWFAVIDNQPPEEERSSSFNDNPVSKALVKARYWLRSQNPERAAELLGTVEKRVATLREKKSWLAQRPVAAICQLGESTHAEQLQPFCRAMGELPLSPWGDAPHFATLVQSSLPDLSSFRLYTGKQHVARKEYMKAQKILVPLHEKFPTSLLTGLLLAEATAGQNNYSKARDFLQTLGGDSGTRCREDIRLAVQAGRPASALSQFYSCYGDIDGGDPPVLAARLFAGSQAVEAVLFARLLWNNGQFQEALAVYQAILAVPVAEQVMTLYRQRMKSDFPGARHEESFWDFLSILRFSKEQQVEMLDALLAPSLLMENAGNSMGVVLAGNSLLLALQKRLAQEYDARIASYERRYRYAEKSYQNLLEEERSLDVMTDLVAIYERMGQYQKEARLYKEMEQSGSLTPVLEQSMERNSQKIAPLSMVDFSLTKKKSDKRYQNIEKLHVGSSFSYLLDLDRFLKFYYGNQHYSSDDGEKSGGSNMAGVDISWQFGRNIEFSGGVGIDKQNGSSDIALLYHGRVQSQLDELVTGFVELTRLEIDDTVQSFDDMLMVSTVSTGLSLETPIGIGFGGDLRYNIRSDKNNGKEFHGFLTYPIFLEKSSLELTYNAYYRDNDEGNPAPQSGAQRLSTGKGPTTYWSPNSYSLHEITSRYQYDFDAFSSQQAFLAEKSGHQLKNSFAAVELAAGVEDGAYSVYSAGFDISLEISPHCLLKGSFGFSHGDETRGMNFSTTLQYRW